MTDMMWVLGVIGSILAGLVAHALGLLGLLGRGTQ